MSFGPSSLYSIKIEEPLVSNSWFPSFSLFVDSEPYDKEYDKFITEGHTYYSLPHNSEYRVRMNNYSGSRVNAAVKIDDESMGVWRIEPYGEIVIERPSHSDRKFVFVREGSWQANMGGVSRGKSKNGLVEVTFVPEVCPRYGSWNAWNDDIENRSDRDFLSARSATNRMSDESLNMQFASSNSSNSSRKEMNFSAAHNMNFSAGGTVLGNDSDQRFGNADRIIEDKNRKVVKRVRLVVKDERKQYTSIKNTAGYDGVYDDDVPPRIDEETDRHRPQTAHRRIYRPINRSERRCPHDDWTCRPPSYYHERDILYNDQFYQ
jgi:hypothetical protein